MFTVGNVSENSRIQNSTSKKGIVAFLFRLASFAFMIQYIAYKITIFVNEHEIISTIHSLHFSKKYILLISKIKVYSYLICYSFILVIAVTFSTNDLNSIIQYINDGNFEFVYYFIGGIFTAITQTSVVIIMIFTSELVSQELNELVVEVNNYGKLDNICK